MRGGGGGGGGNGCLMDGDGVGGGYLHYFVMCVGSLVIKYLSDYHYN